MPEGYSCESTFPSDALADQTFRFDLLLDDNYPMTPPKMKFVLEKIDEDGVPLNPNLHVGGNGK